MQSIRKQGPGRDAPEGRAALVDIARSPDAPGRATFRHGRYAAKRKGAELLETVLPIAAKRLSQCGYKPTDEVVSVKYSRRDKSAWVSGVMRCGSVWLCPNCALAINEKRKQEMDQLLIAVRAAGKAVFLLTLTARHFRGDDVGALVAQLKAALDHLRTGRAWRNLRVHGSVTGTEVTHGSNGFHPHFHMVVLMDQPREEAEGLLAGLRPEWLRSLAKHGLDGNAHAFQLQDGSAAGSYVAKFGAAEEMTLTTAKQGRKGSRSMWQLLNDARDGDSEAGRLWARYAVAFRGRRQLVWSKGLKERYGIDETTDEEAAAGEGEESDVIVLRTWAAKTEWRLARRRICAILAAAETGGDLIAAESGPTDSERWRQAVESGGVVE